MINFIKNKTLNLFLLSAGIIAVNQLHGMEDQIEGKTKIDQATILWTIKGKPELCQFMHKYFVSNENNKNNLFIIPAVKKIEKPIIQINAQGKLSITEEESLIDGIFIKDHNAKKPTKLIAGKNITISFSNDLDITISLKKNLKRKSEQSLKKLEKEKKIKKIYSDVNLFAQKKKKNKKQQLYSGKL